MCKDTFVLRLSNSTIGNEAVELNSDKNACFIRIPADLRNKGKCTISVVEITMSLRNGTGNRVIANGTHIVCIRSNIPQLGYGNEQTSQNQILGSGIVPDNNTNAVQLDSSSSLTFTCGKLPDVIELERMCYDPSNNHNLIAANNFTTDLVPFQVVLQITFDEDDKHNM
jgi:hypothetical protein